MKNPISCVITDIDNTIFDWVTIWYHSFKSMLDKIVSLSGLDEDIILREIKSIHETYGTSEYSMLIDEIPSLRKKHPHKNLTELYAEAINAYREQRNKYLKLYPSVYDTLTKIKKYNCCLIGYTESLEYYTRYRLKKVGLDGVYDFIASPPDHSLPLGAKEKRRYEEDYYKYKLTNQILLPEKALKPNKDLLLEIIKQVNADKSHTIYIGDSLVKDIKMAQEAGVIDVFAEYGISQNENEYELLRKVTHWKDEDVVKEKEAELRRLTNNSLIKPSYVLKEKLDEVFQYFEFVPFNFIRNGK